MATKAKAKMRVLSTMRDDGVGCCYIVTVVTIAGRVGVSIRLLLLLLMSKLSLCLPLLPTMLSLRMSKCTMVMGLGKSGLTSAVVRIGAAAATTSALALALTARPVMCLYVLGEVVASHEALVAYGAGEPFLAGVRSEMPL